MAFAARPTRKARNSTEITPPPQAAGQKNKEPPGQLLSDPGR